jgi:hypothetical protein
VCILISIFLGLRQPQWPRNWPGSQYASPDLPITLDRDSGLELEFTAHVDDDVISRRVGQPG